MLARLAEHVARLASGTVKPREAATHAAGISRISARFPPPCTGQPVEENKFDSRLSGLSL